MKWKNGKWTGSKPPFGYLKDEEHGCWKIDPVAGKYVRSKCSLLNKVKNWPDNFRILLYPELEIFRKYPTIAPNGSMVLDDINRKSRLYRK